MLFKDDSHLAQHRPLVLGPPAHTHTQRGRNATGSQICMHDSLFERLCCCLHQLQDLLWALYVLDALANLDPPTQTNIFQWN